MASLLEVLLLNGCSSNPRSQGSDLVNSSSSLPPAFLSGPASLLLTNVGGKGFSAHVILRYDTPSPIEKNSAGELLGREGKLLFAPEAGKRDKQYSRAGFSFIWDVAGRHNFVISEALQGYAPASFGVGPTNVTSNLQSKADRIVEGHVCQTDEALVEMSDGSRTAFQIVRAIDMNGFPLRIQSFSNSAPYTLTFSKIRRESPSAELFDPPNGFTKYDNVEVMVTELIMRQHQLKTGRAGPSEPAYDIRERK